MSHARLRMSISNQCPKLFKAGRRTRLVEYYSYDPNMLLYFRKANSRHSSLLLSRPAILCCFWQGITAAGMRRAKKGGAKGH
jgi:hypothetical protein